MKCIIFPMFNVYCCPERNKQIGLCKWVSWERRRSGSRVSFALADDCFKKRFQSSKGEKTDLVNMCIYFSVFAQNGFAEQSFDRREAVPVIPVLHERGESSKSYLHSISVRLLA